MFNLHVCDSETAYAKTEVHFGEENRNEAKDSTVSKFCAVVARLTTDFWNKGYHLFFDNYHLYLLGKIPAGNLLLSFAILCAGL